MDNERLVGLIAYLHAYHGGGFVNNAIQRDELLSVLQELMTLRSRVGQDVHHAISPPLHARPAT
jgi:hypothetical protein